MIRRLRNRAVFLIGLTALPLAAGEELPEIRQLTTHPGRDFDPVLSPDGRWLAFCSDRSGNPDIWIKPFPRGTAVQVTRHPSDDTEPAWMPDGKRLVFVSKRRDAEGDLWSVRIHSDGSPHGEPEQWTNWLGFDGHPSVSPDGRRIVFSSRRSGQTDLWLLSVDSKRTVRLTCLGGTHPAWSPGGDRIAFSRTRRDEGASLFVIRAGEPERTDDSTTHALRVTFGTGMDTEPAWSMDGGALIFQRYPALSADALNNARVFRSALWKKRLPDSVRSEKSLFLRQTPEIQITGPLYHDRSPHCGSGGQLTFASSRSSASDIWSMPGCGLFPEAESAEAQYNMVMNRFSAATTPEALHQAILGYKCVTHYFPTDSAECARALIQMGDLYHLLSDDERARSTFRRIVDGYSEQRSQAALALLKLASLKGPPVEERIALCRDILMLYPDQDRVLDEMHILLGDLYLESGRIGESLNAYSQAARPEVRVNRRAQARLKIGDLFQSTGQTENARSSYYAVLKEFGHIPIWRQRAIDRLLGQAEGPARRSMIAYQRIIQDASEFPPLVAQAQLALCRLLIEEGQTDRVLRELQELVYLVPEERWAHAEARILEADVFGRTGDDLKGILRLEAAIREFETLEGGVYAARARDLLFRILFESAESLKRNQDFELAGARYRKALTIRPEDVACHRGLVECMTRTGRIQNQIQDYTEKLQSDPDNPVLLYSLGLAYSYAGDRDIGMLEQSNDFLQRALAEDYRMIYPYRALSYNYESMEKLTEEAEQEKPGLIRSVAGRLLSPLKWLADKLLFGGEESETGYYEKAIEVLITAIELNDEKQNPRMEALLSQNLANNYYNLGEFGFQKAFQYYQVRLALDTVFSSPLEKAVFFERAGHCGVSTDAGLATEGYLKTAIRMYQDLGRYPDVIHNERMLAFYYQLNGQYEEAVNLYQKLADTDEREGRWNELERDYRNAAYNFYLMGEPEDAIEYASRAERILSTQKMPEGPPEKSYLRVGVLGLSIPVWGMEEIGGASSGGFSPAEEAAFVCGLLSRCHEQTGDVDRALHYERKRRDIFASRKDRLGERISRARLGSLYFQKGYYETAWIRFQDVRDQCIRKKDAEGRWTGSVNLARIAVVMLANENRDDHADEALAILKNEEAVLDQEQASADRRLPVQSLMGTLYFLKTKAVPAESESPDSVIVGTLKRLTLAEQAASCFQRALALARETGDWKQESVLLKNLSETSLVAGDRLAGYDYLRSSVRILQKNGEESLLWRLKYSLANQLLSLSAPDRAALDETRSPAILYQEAVSDLESVPVMEETGSPLLSDRADRTSLYEDGAAELLRNGRIEEALILIEKGRQKRIADILARQPPKLRRERHKIAWGNLRYVKVRMHELRKQILEERSGENRPSVLHAARSDLERYQREYTDILQDMRREDPVLAYLSGAWPVDIRSVQEALPHGTGMLCYAAAGDSVHLFALDRDTLFVRTLLFSRSELPDLEQGFLQAVESDSLVDLFGTYLYNGLIAPAESFMNAKTHVIFIPANILKWLPFCALSDGRKFLIDRWSISNAPSLTAYGLAASRRRIPQNRSGVFGLAFSERAEEPVPLQTYVHYLQDLDSLDRVYMNGRFDSSPVNPVRSAFESAVRHDSLTLTVRALFGMDIPASLMVFFHSDSGASESGFDPELWSLALLYAGVPTCGFSPWSASEDSLPGFIGAFDKEIRTESYADALARVQNVMIRDGRPARQWAGIRIWGYEGMPMDSRIRFAEENLVATVMKGRAFAERGEYPDAVMRLEEAVGMARALDDSRAEHMLEREIIATSMQGGLWNKAITYQTRQLEQAVRTGDPAGELRSRNNLAVFYLRNGNPEQALRMKRAALQQVRSTGEKAVLVQTTEEMAALLAQSGRYGQAAAWADTLFRLYESVDDSAGMARTLLLRGRFLLEDERYWPSREALLQSLALYEQAMESAPEPDPDRAAETASVLQHLGLVDEKLVRYDEAIRYQIRALEQFRRLDLDDQAALTRQYLANLYWETGDYRRAIQTQQEAMADFRKQGDQKLLAMAHSTLGLIQMSLGDLDEAQASEREAYRLAEASGNRADQATILKNMGLIAIQGGESGQAYTHFRQASRIDSALGFRRGQATDYRNLGQLLIRMDRTDEAERHLQKGLTLSDSVDDKRNAVQCRLALGELHAFRGEHERALTHLNLALRQSEGLTIPEIAWRIHRRRGAVRIDLGQYEQALDDYNEAIQIVESLRAELKVDALKQGFIDSKMDLYIDMVELLLRLGRTEEAFHFVERAKSRSFIDMLANQDIGLSMVEGGMLQKEKEIRKEIQELQGKVSVLSGEERLTAAEQTELDRLNQALTEARRSYQEMLVQIQEANPELAGFVTVDPIRPDRLRRQIPDSTAVLEYFLTSDRLYIFMIRSSGVSIRRSVFPDAKLETLVKSLREGIESHLSVSSESRTLYDLLILPFEYELAGIQHMVIVPHGILHYLPFAALRREDGAWVIDRWSISLAPSATVLGYCLDKGDTRRKGASSLSVLALANPDLGTPRYDLPFAEKEVVSLQRAFDDVEVYFREEATEKNTRDHASGHSILHFACHATYEPESPLFSALLLKSAGPFEDGRLEAHEIFGLDLNCGLVTLSACETGLARITQGDEIIGLARSFIFAGTPSIITSLWKVDDLATAVMVKRFYRYLSDGLSKAESLRRAQLVVRNSLDSHPSAWAAFGLTGDFRTLR